MLTIFRQGIWDYCFNWWGRYISLAFRCQSYHARKTKRLLQAQMTVSRGRFSVDCVCPEWQCRHWFLPILPHQKTCQVVFAPSPWAISNIIDSLYYKAPFIDNPPIDLLVFSINQDKEVPYIHFHWDQSSDFCLKLISDWYVVLSAGVLGWRYDQMHNI